MYTGGFLRKTTCINSVFTLAVVLSHPPMSLFYTSGYLNEPSVKKRLFTQEVFLTPTRILQPRHLPLVANLEVPKLQNTRGKVLFIYFFEGGRSKRLVNAVSRVSFCMNPSQFEAKLDLGFHGCV